MLMGLIKQNAAVVAANSPQATAFLARTSGLDAAHTNAYATLINGLVSDGIFAKLDALYMLATADATTAQLNLVSTSFGLTPTGAPVFTADAGYTYASGDTHSTNFSPSTAAGHWALNSACSFVYSNTSASNGGGALGDTNFHNFIYPRQTATAYFGINDPVAFGVNASNADGKGLYAADRASNTVSDGYKNGASIASAGAIASALQALPILIGDTAGGGNWVGILLGAGLGGSLTSGDHANLYARIHTYMQTIAGIP